ncbi:MAG: acetyltransferase [Anaerolineae bacterium]|nr:acetyltransferase [Anaerolineae bacterium]
MTVRVLILGAGGHAQVVADILLRMRENGASLAPIGYLDDNLALKGRCALELPVMGDIAQLVEIPHEAVVVAIGNNAIRQRLFESLRHQGEHFVTAQHPRAIVAPDVDIGIGSMICAGAIVNPSSVIGANVILNTGSTVDHHNRIGDHVHIAPGAHLGGDVVIGEGALIGIGATVMPSCQIGAWSVIGAAALVHRNVPAYVTAVGAPARVIKQRIHERGVI